MVYCKRDLSVCNAVFYDGALTVTIVVVLKRVNDTGEAVANQVRRSRKRDEGYLPETPRGRREEKKFAEKARASKVPKPLTTEI